MAEAKQEYLDLKGLTEYHSKVNDMTTGINFVRRSKDFGNGFEKAYSYTNSIFKDGFGRQGSAAVYSSYQDDNGFTVLHMKATGNSDNNNAAYNYASPVYDIAVGDVYTVSFDFMVEDVKAWDVKNALRIGLLGETSVLQTESILADQTNVKASEIQNGKWYQVVYYYNVVNPNAKAFIAGTILTRNGSVYYRKFSIQKGHINNPEWSPSPFDVDRINDMTTGINLLRGTRDFTIGVDVAGVRESALKSDGVYFNADQWEIITPDDPNEFAYAKRIPTGTASHLYFNPLFPKDINDTKFTVSFEFMLEEKPTKHINLFQFLVQNNSSTASGGKEVNINTSYIGFLDYNDIPINTWIKASYVIEDVSLTDDQYIRLGLNGSSNDEISKCVRKVKFESGRINNPLWSASPFDTQRINDETTGINLVRGTRDFRLGVNTLSSLPYVASDGFVNANSFEFYKDEDGFTVAKKVAKGLTSNGDANINASTIHISPGQNNVFTISFDVMFDEDVVCDKFTIARIYQYNWPSTPVIKSIYPIFFNMTGISERNIEYGKWYRAVYTFTTEPETTMFRVVLTLQMNGSINFRKLMVQRGSIENPVWSASPFDEIDITQGSTGWTRGLNSGINIVPETSDEWSNWIEPTYNATNINFYPTHLSNIPFPTERNLGDVYTVSIEVEFDNVTFTPGQTGIFRLQGKDDGQWLSANPLYGPAEGNTSTPVIMISNFDNGHKNLIAHSYKRNDAYLNNLDHYEIGFRLDYWASGRFRYRRIKIERGYVEYPKWSPAIEDTLKTNDMTTGINLLRGSRDCTTGTIPYGTKDSIKLDGTSTPPSSVYEVIVGDDGFSYLYYTGTASSASYKFLSALLPSMVNGHTLTFSFEFMIEKPTSINGVLLQLYKLSLDGSSDAAMQTYTLGDIGYRASDLEPFVWYKAVCYYDTVLNLKDNEYIRVGLTGGIAADLTRTIRFRKYKAEIGHIYDPVWSSSPFDTALTTDVPKISFNDVAVTPVNTPDQDTYDFWNSADPGVYQFRGNGHLNGQPSNYGYLLNFGKKDGAEVSQLWIPFGAQTEDSYCLMAYRSANHSFSGNQMPTFIKIFGGANVLDVQHGGTGSTSVEAARDKLGVFRPVSNNIINNVSDDTYDFWKNKEPGIYTFSSNNTLVGQTASFGTMFHLNGTGVGNPDIVQLLFNRGFDRSLYIRKSDSTDAGKAMPSFIRVMDENHYAYNPGTYSGTSITSKFQYEIGSSGVANWLASRASQGNFDGICIGDYVDIACTGVTRRYIVAAIDPYYNLGSPTRMGHHIVMVPEKRWDLSSSRDGSYAVGTSSIYIKWSTAANNNGTATENSPYVGSNLHKWESEVAIKQFPKEWQDVMLDYTSYVETRYSASSTLSESTGAKWVNLGKLWSPSTIELFGRSNEVSNEAARFGTQFPLFSKPTALYKGSSLWTRDTSSGNTDRIVCASYLGGLAPTLISSEGTSPLPCFLIG